MNCLKFRQIAYICYAFLIFFTLISCAPKTIDILNHQVIERDLYYDIQINCKGNKIPYKDEKFEITQQIIFKDKSGAMSCGKMKINGKWEDIIFLYFYNDPITYKKDCPTGRLIFWRGKTCDDMQTVMEKTLSDFYPNIKEF